MAPAKLTTPVLGFTTSLDALTRFGADFIRLMRDVDRLISDVNTANEQLPAPLKRNGRLHHRLKNGDSTLSSQAEMFAASLQQSTLLLDRIPVPLMQLDGNARILRTNEECSHVLKPAAPLSGQSLFRFVTPSDAGQLRKQLALARATNKACVANVSILFNGRRSPLALRIRRHFLGNQLGYVAVIEDARSSAGGNKGQEQEETHRSLHELAVRLSAAEALAPMLDIVARHCRQALRSPAGVIFLERSGRLEVAAQWPLERIHNRDQDRAESMKGGAVAHAFRAGTRGVWRESLPDPSMSAYFRPLLRRIQDHEFLCLPIKSPAQPPVGVMAIALGQPAETESGRHEQLARIAELLTGFVLKARVVDEAVSARQQAESIVRSKDSFLSMVSHELKNSMAPVLGWAVALSSGNLPPEKQSIALESIIRNVRILNYMVNDLFDTASIASGKLHLQLSETRIQDVAREALSVIQSMIQNKRLRITTDISEAIPPLIADCRRLQQALVNLLINAVKFTPPGGSITLRVRRRGDSIECVVSDTGRGISRKLLPEVFERFRQGNRTINGQNEGLGLGLAIVRDIVELHGGTARVFSEGARRGSTFVIRLPIQQKNHGNGRGRPQPAAD